MNKFKEFRNIITDSNEAAFGCSHTWGVGVEADETWAYLLGAKNYGVGSSSADTVVRVAQTVYDEVNFSVAYVLWPDWTRFDINENGHWRTVLPTNRDRIKYVETHPEEWLKDNFRYQVNVMRDFCKRNDIKLVDMSLYDLIPYIDHADKWPLSKLGHHYAPSWHQQVADIFRNSLIKNIAHPISND